MLIDSLAGLSDLAFVTLLAVLFGGWKAILGIFNYSFFLLSE